MAIHEAFIEEVRLDGVILTRLMPGEDLFFKAIVFTTTEIVIGKIVGSSVHKAKSDVTGLIELFKK
jgi:predicted DNA-binding protein with PD1-like motif